MKLFLMGIGIGMGVGALVAPKAGNDTREFLRSRAFGLLNDVSEQAGFSKPMQQGTSVIDALNTMSRDKLLCIYGIGPLTADKIIKHRPYDSPEALLQRGIIPDSSFESLHQELLKYSA